MREFFSQFGKVIDSTVMLDRETGRSKGFGFVSFEDTNVQPFLGFGNLEIDGKLVCIEFCFVDSTIECNSTSRLMSSSHSLVTNVTVTRMKMAQARVEVTLTKATVLAVVLVLGSKPPSTLPEPQGSRVQVALLSTRKLSRRSTRVCSR